MRAGGSPLDAMKAEENHERSKFKKVGLKETISFIQRTELHIHNQMTSARGLGILSGIHHFGVIL